MNFKARLVIVIKFIDDNFRTYGEMSHFGFNRNSVISINNKQGHAAGYASLNRD